MTVNLTLPLSTYLRLARRPGPAGRATARSPPAWPGRSPPTPPAEPARRPDRDTWRCVVTDDTHGTVLGVGAPIRPPRHDPPPRLADLVRAMEPTCCFPGCRTRARRLRPGPPHPLPPRRPGRGARRRPDLLLQPRAAMPTHHRLKTAGLIGIRRLGDAEAAAMTGGRPRHPRVHHQHGPALPARTSPSHPGPAGPGRPPRRRPPSPTPASGTPDAPSTTPA